MKRPPLPSGPGILSMIEPVKINRVPALVRICSSWRGKSRNKELLERLAGYNRDLWPPDEIRSAVGIGLDDLSALDSLARLPEGGHDFIFYSETAPGDYSRLAVLGLILLKWPIKKIYLTDAGRFFLSLTAIAGPINNEEQRLTNEDQ